MAVAFDEERVSNPREEIQYFYLVDDLRRSALYVTVGCLLIGVLFWLVAEERTFTECVVASSITFVFSLWMLHFVVLARVKVDDQGVSRRVLFWWDLWPWEAFADGRVQHVERRSINEYQNSARPWGFNRLQLETLNKEDEFTVDAIIRTVWTPPQLEPLPDKIWTTRARYNGKMVKHVELNATGLVVARKHETIEFPWSAVTRVEILRRETGRADFVRMMIYIDGNELQLIQESENASVVEVLSDFVTQHAPADKLHEFAFKGPVRNLEELEFRIEQEKKKLRGYLHIKLTVCVTLPFSLLGIVFAPKDDLQGPLLLFIFSFLGLSTARFHQKESVRFLQEYECAREKFGS